VYLAEESDHLYVRLTLKIWKPLSYATVLTYSSIHGFISRRLVLLFGKSPKIYFFRYILGECLEYLFYILQMGSLGLSTAITDLQLDFQVLIVLQPSIYKKFV